MNGYRQLYVCMFVLLYFFYSYRKMSLESSLSSLFVPNLIFSVSMAQRGTVFPIPGRKYTESPNEFLIKFSLLVIFLFEVKYS